MPNLSFADCLYRTYIGTGAAINLFINSIKFVPSLISPHTGQVEPQLVQRPSILNAIPLAPCNVDLHNKTSASVNRGKGKY